MCRTYTILLFGENFLESCLEGVVVRFSVIRRQVAVYNRGSSQEVPFIFRLESVALKNKNRRKASNWFVIFFQIQNEVKTRNIVEQNSFHFKPPISLGRKVHKKQKDSSVVYQLALHALSCICSTYPEETDLIRSEEHGQKSASMAS